MFFRQYQLGCLSILSYMIGDETTGRAVVVDPQRDITQYLEDAGSHGLKVERVVETHFHADFLSGHLELADATGATISYGPGAQADFPIEVLAHGQRLSLGDVMLEIRSTPGHTPESICVVVWEHADDPSPWGVLTGDTLFIGDVGRPDLLGSVGWTPEALARELYRSVRDQLLSLPGTTRVFPAHSAGSACGKQMSSATASTIAEQLASNYALAAPDEASFVESVVQGQSVAPLYFPYAAGANRHVHQLLDDHDPPPHLAVDEALALQDKGAVVLDTRAPEVFASGHLRGSVNVGIDGRFAEYSGDVARPDDTIVLVTEPGRETEAKVRLARIGFDNVAGVLPEAELVLVERPELAEPSLRLPASDLGQWGSQGASLQLVDVRNPGEVEAGIIEGARCIPLAQLLDRVGELDPARTTIVYCAGGYRSSIAASLLLSKGFARVADILGGFDAWTAAGLPSTPPDAALQTER